DGKVVDGFIGAVPERAVRDFVERLSPPETEADRLAHAGDETSLRAALELQSDHPEAVPALAELLARRGDGEEALALLERVPESAETRRIASQPWRGWARPRCPTTWRRSSTRCSSG